MADGLGDAGGDEVENEVEGVGVRLEQWGL
jgi:hypothetical protein